MTFAGLNRSDEDDTSRALPRKEETDRVLFARMTREPTPLLLAMGLPEKAIEAIQSEAYEVYGRFKASNSALSHSIAGVSGLE